MTPKDYFLHDALCPLPWVGVFVNPDGVIKNCAISRTDLGNLHNTPIKEILVGQKNTDIKTDMLNHVKHPRCNTCYQVENRSDSQIQTHSGSNRSWYKKYGLTNLSLYSSPSNFSLKVLDLRWRNTCNLACVYCGPDLSSKWASELNNVDYTINDHILDETKKYIFDQIENIEHIYLAGGEPLLIKENLELLELAYEKNPDVEIRINTNLSVIDNKIFKKLLTFKNVKWTISVDDVGEKYNYIRYPGDWNKFYSNLIELKNQNFDINFNMVWCILNANSIFDCIDHLQSAGFHENAFIIQCLNTPIELNVKNLPAEKLENLKLTIKNKLNVTNSSYWLHKSLNLMYNYISAPLASSNIEQTYNFLKVIDLRRNLDSKKVFPSLYNL
jgi:MoaA/NifB/PqqE/SkfB family radical SAM enzyme